MTDWSVKRINRALELFSSPSYLEVGVFEGETFLNIGANMKTAVDPKFRFDTQEQERPGVFFAEKTSNAYFADLHPDTVFDVVFLDGLHTFEQTYRDLTAALLHTHQDSLILIDDVVPSDVFSAMRDQSEAYNARDAHGGKGRKWHGDVFKVVFAIHDYHLGLDYRTITGSGNPQCLVWRSPGSSRQPRLQTWEAVSRLDFFELDRQRDVLKECSEEVAFASALSDRTSSRPDEQLPRRWFERGRGVELTSRRERETVARDRVPAWDARDVGGDLQT